MTKYAMAIDLKRCVGCGACAFACKTENNTDIEQNGKRFNWADFYVRTNGRYSTNNVKHWVFPTLCNHCTNAPCITACPANPKALYKTPDGITMLNHNRCIGCGYCINHCPYSDHDVDAAKVQYSVLTRNPSHYDTHVFWSNNAAIIENCTMTPAEVVTQVGKRPPHVHEYTDPDTASVRPRNKTEKCTFCAHRLAEGKIPYCVVSCPAHARLFGDLDNPSDEIHQWLSKGYVRLKNNKGELVLQNESYNVGPNIYYVNFENLVGVEETPEVKPVPSLKLAPNPANTQTRLIIEVDDYQTVDIGVYDVSGRMVINMPSAWQLQPGKNEHRMQISQLNPGTYVVRIANSKFAASTNLVVHH